MLWCLRVGKQVLDQHALHAMSTSEFLGRVKS
jgi:hypothetical protein